MGLNSNSKTVGGYWSLLNAKFSARGLFYKARLTFVPLGIPWRFPSSTFSSWRACLPLLSLKDAPVISALPVLQWRPLDASVTNKVRDQEPNVNLD